MKPPPPPSTTDLLSALRSVALASPVLVARLGGPHVYAPPLPASLPYPAAALLVSETGSAFAPSLAADGMTRPVSVLVRAEVAASAHEGYNASAHLDGVLRAAYDALVSDAFGGQRASVNDALGPRSELAAAVSLLRPSGPLFADDGRGVLFKQIVLATALRPRPLP